VKLGIIGDTHFTNRGPERRLDNYFETQMNKLAQALLIFNEYNCDVIIQTGDFCNSPNIADRVKSALIRFLRQSNRKILCVFGQHDVTGHSASTLPNSPLAVFEAADVVKLLDGNWWCEGHTKDEVPICILGANFGEEIPKTYEKDAYNILVIHKMIGDRPLYPGQELISPNQFLRNYPSYDLVICGDYHYRFISTYQGRTIINPGALVRKTISKFDLEHKPAVVVFDTGTNKAEVIELKVKPVEKVFNLKRIEKVNHNEIMIDFVRRLKDSKGEKIGWKEVLIKVLNERKSNKKVREIIDECLEEATKC